MPTTISVMSWNVRNLGDSKTTLPNQAVNGDMRIMELIADETVRQGIQVVGIMEIQSGIGLAIALNIIADLNNRPNSSGRWAYRLSSRQDGGTQEEYLFVVDCAAGSLRFDVAGRPAQSSLMGVFDESVIEDFSANPLHRDELLTALVSQEYIERGIFHTAGGSGKIHVLTKEFRVNPDKWLALSTGANVVFPPPQTPFVAGLTPANLTRLKNKLLDVDILKFTKYGDRSPFMLQLLVGPNLNSTPLTIVLAHQLGTSNPLRFDSINIMALNRVLIANAQAGQAMILMGDYNVAAHQMKMDVSVYGRSWSQNSYGLNKAKPPQTNRIFAPILAWPNSVDLLGDQATSLTRGFLANGSPPANALSSAYDKLMLFNIGNAQPGRVINLVNDYNQPALAALPTAQLAFARAKASGIGNFITEDQDKIRKKQNEIVKKNTQTKKLIASIAPKVTSKTPADSPIRARLVKLRAERTVYDGKIAQLQAQIDAGQFIFDQINSVNVIHPAGIGISLAVYSYAVSDHLPVSVKFTLG